MVKPQYVDQIPKAVKGADKSVEPLLKARSQMDNMEHIMDVLGMLDLLVCQAHTDPVQSFNMSRTGISACSPVESFSDLLLLWCVYRKLMCMFLRRRRHCGFC